MPWKGVALAIEALLHLPGWRLRIVGSGPDEARLRARPADAALAGRVEFAGWLPRARVPEMMRDEADVLLFPSLPEGGGWAIAEASACGLPVVCLDHSGPPSLAGSACGRRRRAQHRAVSHARPSVGRNRIWSWLAILPILLLVPALVFLTPPPSSTDPLGAPFGTRPASGPVHLVGCHDVVIENRTFRQLGAGVIAISLENCQHVTIRAVDFVDVAEGIYALNSSDITIEYARYSNIIGPAQPRTGAHVGNFVQLDKVTGATIRQSKGKGGDTEDIVNVGQSQNVLVEDNQFQGTNWTSGSSSGIALCDGGGSNNVAQRNILLNPGQVGAFIGGGTNCKLLNNTIYGAQRPSSNVGAYIWNQSSSACSGVTVNGNQVRWYNAAGSLNGFWNAGNCGPVTGTNQWNVLLDPLALGVKL